MQKLNIITAASLAIALAGCGSIGSNASLYSANQPVVERTNYAIDVNLDGSGVSVTEEQRVAQWFNALKLGYGDRIAIDFGGGYPNAAARQDVADIASRNGMLVVDNAPVTQGNIMPGTARIVVTRSTASVPECGGWENGNDSNFNSKTHKNYGCATNSNIAAMIADPEDLIRGKEDNSNDNSAGNQAINAYRTKTSGGNP